MILRKSLLKALTSPGVEKGHGNTGQICLVLLKLLICCISLQLHTTPEDTAVVKHFFIPRVLGGKGVPTGYGALTISLQLSRKHILGVRGYVTWLQTPTLTFIFDRTVIHRQVIQPGSQPNSLSCRGGCKPSLLHLPSFWWLLVPVFSLLCCLLRALNFLLAGKKKPTSFSVLHTK